MGETTPDLFLSLKNLMAHFQNPCKGVGYQHPENNRISHCTALGVHFQSIDMSQLSNRNL